MQEGSVIMGQAVDEEIHEGFGVFERQNQAPTAESSDFHTILFSLPLPEDPDHLPVPLEGDDKWDDDHVKLPNSLFCKYKEIDEAGNVQEKLRWDLIEESLTSSKISNSQEFEGAVKKYFMKSDRIFNSYHELFENSFLEEDADLFFDNILPKIIELALRLPELMRSPIPLLKKTMNKSISMSQEQAACLLANAFLCTFPSRNQSKKNTDYPEINFNRLFSCSGNSVVEKLKCLCNYFRRICTKAMPTGVLTFQRRFIDALEFPDLGESTANFSSTKLILSSKATIEDGAGMLQVDFANRYLGGGALGQGCVQEEIRFVINPEMIVGMLFCESMSSTEAIVMTGCEQFNKYSGYAGSFEWSGNFFDKTPCDEFRRRMTYVVAIDALSFHKPYLQFENFTLTREVRKAFVGFYHNPLDETKPIAVCSGNWGCGAFRGFKPLKAIIQLIACCLNQRNLFYCTFGEIKLEHEINRMFQFIKRNEITVGMLWGYLKDFKENKLANKPDELYPFICKRHAQKKSLAEIKANKSESDIEDNDEIKEDKPTSTNGTSETLKEEEIIESQEGIPNVPQENPAKRQKISEEADAMDSEFKSENLEDLLKNFDCKIEQETKPAATNDPTHKFINSEPGQTSTQQEESTKALDSQEAASKSSNKKIPNPPITKLKTIKDYFKPKS